MADWWIDEAPYPGPDVQRTTYEFLHENAGFGYTKLFIEKPDDIIKYFKVDMLYVYDQCGYDLKKNDQVGAVLLIDGEIVGRITETMYYFGQPYVSFQVRCNA